MERDSFLLRIRARLTSRYAELEDERGRVRAALQALEPAAARRPKPKPDPPALSRRLLRMISEDPGVRTSMLALEVGKPPDAVGRVIERMHERGMVQRDGRGWRVSSPPTPDESVS